ncbi:hypothetical protein BCR33DRAFT_72221 [Rhizoclosmatium globosum]|uniref:Uncharacterized protein n=1 Tax=Rhizoclosmatium globosum TaxID=329046 RepID=A0A1Y2ASX6_9FUNG|nr:hypothetical protein BCR33DRAFT_72221 [Rhizoclosmatium globosum]|eukprot:ORY25669.1 hypothetical protein BCR33DRAFT_72221 [Rhizoclosmatium globosum]
MKSLLEFQRFGFLLGLIIVALTFQIYYAYRSRRSDQVYNGNGKDEGALLRILPQMAYFSSIRAG